ncbi:MAG TPA: class I SAM-dependent methyltransferase [Gaiellaceae bacterium]|nr:class I SAM-dependent methyltransferase [Gaiellaceae bacterium]
MSDYRDFNKASWDERVPAHAASPNYAVARFAEDPGFLSGVVTFDRSRLGEIAGLDAVHLQCHIGTDTVSLGRLGARMTGLDFSAPAIEQARRLAESAGVAAEFVVADVYDAVEALGAARFDLVYTGIGAICWLPDIRRWAAVVAALLRPGGRLFIREGHPVLWTLDDVRADGLLSIEHPYYEHEEPSVWDEGGTYVETDQVFTANLTHEWNHGLGEIVTALLEVGMELTMLEEHDSVPWKALPGLMAEGPDGEWRLTDRPRRLPASYTIQARLRS